MLKPKRKESRTGNHFLQAVGKSCFCQDGITIYSTNAGAAGLFVTAIVSDVNAADSEYMARKLYEAITKILIENSAVLMHERIFASKSSAKSLNLLSSRLAVLDAAGLDPNTPLSLVQVSPCFGEGLAGAIFHAVPARMRNIETLRDKDQKWKPSRALWEKIKKAALEKPLTITIRGVKADSSEQDEDIWVSHGEVAINVSSDPVGAPIFFREVPLPFDYANQYPEKIRYRLGYVSNEHESKVLLENLPLCGNCHSFSKDGSVLGMDVDYANDKGSYVVTELDRITDLTPDKIITWSNYKRENETLTFGLLSSVSPNGKHVVSTVKDRSIFVGLPENPAYSQLFFPIKGILTFYDRETETYLYSAVANTY